MTTNAALLVEWRNGQQGLFRVLDSTSYSSIEQIVYGRHGSLVMSNGNIVVHSPKLPIPGAEPVTWKGQENCYRIRVPGANTLADEGLIEHFVDCIKELRQPTCSGAQQLHAHEIMFKGDEAARTGITQELETSFAPWHSIDGSFHEYALAPALISMNRIAPEPDTNFRRYPTPAEPNADSVA